MRAGKTAERILLELKGRLSLTAVPEGDLRGDALSALVNLGYAQREATRVIDQVLKDEAEKQNSILIRKKP